MIQRQESLVAQLVCIKFGPRAACVSLTLRLFNHFSNQNFIVSDADATANEPQPCYPTASHSVRDNTKRIIPIILSHAQILNQNLTALLIRQGNRSASTNYQVTCSKIKMSSQCLVQKSYFPAWPSSERMQLTRDRAAQ